MFDNIVPNDVIIAFFPCVRFEEKIMLGFRGELYGMQSWDDEKKLRYSMKLNEEQNDLYQLISKMVIVVLRKGLRMIIENPYGVQHYLVKYFPIKSKIIDKDRSKNGDYRKKPTQYWFIGCEPEQNFIFEPIAATKNFTNNGYKVSDLGCNRTVGRSMIHPQYARRFIKMYLTDGEFV